MKTFALAFLAAMPMACLANLGAFDLKYVYYKAPGSDDKCKHPPQEVSTEESGTSHTLFHCDGKKAGDEICYCIAGMVNGLKLHYENLCATCSLAAKPNKGFTQIFQFGQYHNLLLNLVKKITLKQELTDDDLYVFGKDNNIKIPMVSPKKMANYTLQFKKFINIAPKAKDADKKMVNDNIDAAFKIYSGLEDLKSMHEHDEHLIENFKKVIPRILEELGIGNNDVCKSDEFKKKLDQAIELVKPEILDGHDEKEMEEDVIRPPVVD